MCGINGYLQFEHKHDKDALNAIIHAMNEKIIHRGPDDEGQFVNEDIALGMRRLSIIDLDNGGQPIFNDDKSKLIVFNGEIYNYQSIRADLEVKGVKFTTHSDTEVILKSYEHYGEKCLDLFSGMFAFAIYDTQEKSLFIARDRAGEKPLYYYQGDHFFCFSSELKGIESHFEKVINKNALRTYFMLSYIPSPETIYQGVYKLEPGSYMKVGESHKSIKKYWQFRIKEESKTSLKEEKKKLRKILTDAVEETMISDVPIGAFLSGGIDSGIVTALMSKISKKPINTFTVSFTDRKYDESKLARRTAKKNQTNHYEIQMDFKSIIGDIDNIITQFDEPFADDSALGVYLISSHASNHVKVCLTGDGSDEIFAGYNKYLVLKYSYLYNSLPRFLQTLISKISNKLPSKSVLRRKLSKVIETAHLTPQEQHINLMSMAFKSSELNDLFKQYKRETNSSRIEDKITELYNHQQNEVSDLSKGLNVDFKYVLEGSMLTKVDRMAMMNSLETRSPFLNTKLLNYLMSLPSELKLKRLKGKLLLRKTFKELLDKKVHKGTKRGFSIPISEWFQSDLYEEFVQLTREEFIRKQNLFNYKYLESLLLNHTNGIIDNGRKLWSIYVFQKWYTKNYLS